VDGGFDGNEYVDAVRDSFDGSGGADDASESTRNHTVEGANLIMLLEAWEIKELRIEKIEIELSRQAEGQRLAIEQVDAEKCLAAGECRPIGQWEHSDRRHAKEAEGRTARRVARNK